jgi:hypothetical protein
MHRPTFDYEIQYTLHTLLLDALYGAVEHVWILHFYFLGRGGIIHFLVDRRAPAVKSTASMFLIKTAVHAPDITDRSRPTGTCWKASVFSTFGLPSTRRTSEITFVLKVLCTKRVTYDSLRIMERWELLLSLLEITQPTAWNLISNVYIEDYK